MMAPVAIRRLTAEDPIGQAEDIVRWRLGNPDSISFHLTSHIKEINLVCGRIDIEGKEGFQVFAVDVDSEKEAIYDLPNTKEGNPSLILTNLAQWHIHCKGTPVQKAVSAIWQGSKTP